MALIKDEIFKILWTSYYHNGIYVLRTEHTCTMSLFISAWLLKRYKVSWTCIYKILWGSIFQGCYGYGKVMGKIIFKVGQKSEKIFDIVAVRNHSANSIYAALKIL